MKIAAFLRRLPMLALAASLVVIVVAQAASADAAPAPSPVATPWVTASTATSITLYWKAPADPTIVGYAMYANGTRVAGVQNIHYMFSNLKCGTGYDLSLDSYNQPQTHSARTSITTSTAPCVDAPPPAPVTIPPAPPVAATPAPAPKPTPVTSTPAPVTSPQAPPVAATPAPAPKPTPVTSTPAPKPTPVTPAPTPVTPPAKPVLVPAPSATPSGGIFVSAGGSDVNPCSQARPCQTFDRAYHLAQPGQVVQVTGGTYPAQSLSRDAAKVNASSNVVFQAVSGQLAILGGLTLSDVHHVTFLGASKGDLSAPSSGLTLRTSPGTMNTGADFNAATCSSSVLVKDVDMRQFGIDGSDNVSIDGGTVGGYDNSGGDSHVGGPYLGRGTANCAAENPSGILITRVLFHDVLRTNLPSAHPDCLQFFGTSGAVVNGNKFVSCGTSNIMARPNPGLWSGNALDNLVLQNNSFSPSVEGGAVAVLGAAADSCGNIAVLNNVSTGGISAFSCGLYASLRVVGNVAAVSSYTCLVALQKANVMFSGNSSCNSVGGASGAATTVPRTPSAVSAPASPAVAPVPAAKPAASSGSSLVAARLKRLLQAG